MEGIKVYIAGATAEEQAAIQAGLSDGNFEGLKGAKVVFVEPRVFKVPKFRIGQRLRDKVTGFEGIVTAYIQHITGCDTYALTPPVDKDGKTRDSNSFDDSRLVLLDNGILDTPVQEVVDDADGKPRKGASEAPLTTEADSLIS
jgi:hypothetical protein